MKLYAWIALSLVLVSQAFAVTLPYTFTTTLPPSQINANFSALRDATNAHEALRNGHNTRLEDVTTVNNSVGTHPINFNNKELFSARVENLSADPTCGASVLGKVIWNTTDHLMKVCDGSTFVSIAGSGVNTLASVLTAGNSAGAHDLDLNDNELLNARMENVSGPISPGFAGRIVFSVSDNSFYGDDGTNVTAFAGAQGLSSVLTTSNSAGAKNIDFNGNQAVKLRGEQLSSDPGTSYAGRLYYNTTGNKFRFHNGSAWADVGNTNTLADVLALGNSTGSYDLNLNSNELLNAIIQNNVGDPSTGVPGQIWFETGADALRFGTSGANRTVATLDGSETLTNKSISGSSNTITNVPDSALSSNIPKKDTAATISGAYTFSSAPTVSAIKTPSGASHTLTDGLSNDTIVLANAAQTLAGKTLNAPTLSGNLDFNDFQAVDMRLENRTSNPTTATGKMYYNTATGEVRYYTGSSWRVLTSNTAGGSAWGTSGNSGTTPGTDFLGTSDSKDLVIKTNGTERFRITSDGALDTTLGAGVVQSNASGVLSSSALAAPDIGFTPGVVSDWTSTPATVQAALDELGGRSAAGDVTGQSSSVDGEVALFFGTGGKTIKRATGSGIAKITSGVLGTATAGTDYVAATSGSAIQKADGSGGLTAASSGTDYEVPLTASGGVTRSTNDLRLANMAAHTIKGNNTGSSAAPTDLTASQVATELDGFFVDSVGTIDSQAKSANGAVMTAGGQLIMQTATPGFPGVVSDSTQTFTGAKTFTSAPVVTAGIKVQETTGSGNNKVTITEPEDIASDFTFPLPVSDATAQDGTMALFRTSTGSQWKVPSGGAGAGTIYSARIVNNVASSGVCATVSGSVRPTAWIQNPTSFTRPGAGQCSVVPAVGTFTKAPQCWISVISGAVVGSGQWASGAPSTTLIPTVTYNNSTLTGSDLEFFLYCKADD